MTLKIYNTMTRQKEPFEPLQDKQVRMYVCGPTVYDSAHVGHAMSSIVFDVIRRYLEYRGYEVEHVMNYTDVDDKVILRANDLGLQPLELANQYIGEYNQLIEKLNILPAQEFPRVSGEIDQIIKVIEGLIEKGYAYEVEGDVFFRVSKDDDYGRLSRRDLEDMRAGARLGIDERKEDPADFALWKSTKPGEPSWESPWGLGRPGWHIECSAMSLHHLGEQIDIHGGGNDLIFPHHENEIAQSESYTGKRFAKYWVHNGMMQLSGAAMSKSTGNVLSADAFLEDHEPDALRLLILNASYRSPITFNEEVVEQAEAGLARLRGALRPAIPEGDAGSTAAAELRSAAEKASQEFTAAMDDDFNTAGALGHLFDLVKAINQARSSGADQAALDPAQKTLKELSGVLGLQLEQEPETPTAEIGPFIELLLDVRRDLREREEYDLADSIRERLSELGVTIEDSKGGTVWHT
ncbi:MAG: cysteine--tRNA ligase [Anaerolineales bacterium]|jgi:cysteinyl-tRNA synthetase